MSEKDEYRELKRKKLVLAKLRDAFAEMQGSAENVIYTAKGALRYTLPDTAWIKRWLKRIGKLKGPRERCPSGILLSVPLAVPLRVLAWLSLKRLYEIHDTSMDTYYYFVCLDDIGKATQLNESTISSNMWLRGVATKQQLENMISAFSFVLARLAKTNKFVRFSKRLQLANELEKAVWDTIAAWAEEGGGVAER